MKFSHYFSRLLVFLGVFICVCLVVPDMHGQTVSEEALKSMNYRNIGPTRQSGRFVDFAVPEQEPYTFYAATGSGGLWKTTNNGQTFEPIFDII